VATTNDQRLKLGVKRRFGAAGGVSKLAQESSDVGITLADPSPEFDKNTAKEALT